MPVKPVTLKKKLTHEQYKVLNLIDWPVCGKEVSQFSSSYDKTWECYFFEGLVTIEFNGGFLDIEPAEFVVFPKGLKCVWNIKKNIKKHYRFIN